MGNTSKRIVVLEEGWMLRTTEHYEKMCPAQRFWQIYFSGLQLYCRNNLMKTKADFFPT